MNDDTRDDPVGAKGPRTRVRETEWMEWIPLRPWIPFPFRLPTSVAILSFLPDTSLAELRKKRELAFLSFFFLNISFLATTRGSRGNVIYSRGPESTLSGQRYHLIPAFFVSLCSYHEESLRQERMFPRIVELKPTLNEARQSL